MVMKVIIVDDEKISRDYIKSLIDWQKEGFDLVGEAQSSDEAMNLLYHHHIDIVLLDVYMPGENGVSLSRRIADCYPHVAMIAISSYDNYDYVREILKNGVHDYILKHRLNGEVLLSALRATSERMGKQNNTSMDLRFRQRMEAWLFHTGDDPYAGDTGRVTVMIASVSLNREIPDELSCSIIRGILDILEEKSNSECMMTAIYHATDYFIVCSRFHSTVSEADIHNKLYLQNMKNKNNIKLVYGLDYASLDSFLPLKHTEVPGIVQQYLINPAHQIPNSYFPKRHIALRLEQQKQLLVALDEQNEQGVSILVKNIYKQIPVEDRSARMIITKELLDILMQIAREYGVSEGYMQKEKKLFDLASGKDSVALSNKMSELFCRLIQSTIRQEVSSKYVKMTNQYIKRHYAEDIGLQDVAKYVGVSESYLSRIYREETGMTFVDSLNQIRINAAKGYLSGDMSIKEAAFMCGFRKYNYFFKVFKKYEGVTPREYLKSNLSKKY